MKILTWNIQATKGCDNRFDLDRIANHIKQYPDLDVICLQEVAKYMPEFKNNDQPNLIHNQFPDFEMIWGPGFGVSNNANKRCEFGNLTLVKSASFKRSCVHNLPNACAQEPRGFNTMVETIVDASGKDVVVFNTHLAFQPTFEQLAQIQKLTVLRDDILDNSNTTGVILCGDLNVPLESTVFTENITDRGWVDCWIAQSKNTTHNRLRPHTCGCHDHKLWPQGAHTRDYFLASKNISSKTIRVGVDVKTNASDHQPVLLEIAL